MILRPNEVTGSWSHQLKILKSTYLSCKTHPMGLKTVPNGGKRTKRIKLVNEDQRKERIRRQNRKIRICFILGEYIFEIGSQVF